MICLKFTLPAAVFVGVYILCFLFVVPTAEATSTRIFLTSGTSWTVPSDWNSASNTIEVIGGGGGGAASPGSGGGGGGYSQEPDVTLTADASVTYAVGAAASDTYFCDSSSNCADINGSAVVVGAKGGANASLGVGGVGGAAASGVGTTKYSGGAGHAGSGGGGGGAGGPNGNGANGGKPTGGSGGGGSGGAGGGSATNGGNGTEWSSSPDYGSGGGGGGSDFGGAGNGGNYGGGGAGSLFSTGTGAPGLIVITYTPVATTSTSTVTTNSAVVLSQSGAKLHGSITDTGGDDATEHGFAYSTNSSLATGVSTTTLGSFAGTGNFNNTISGLLTDTTYYFRAYASNTAGFGYGTIRNFTTGNTQSTARIKLLGGSTSNPLLKLFGLPGAIRELILR